MVRVVGIDPGAYGALALIVDGRLVEIHDMPILKVRRGKSDKAEVDGYTLGDLAKALAPDLVYVEQVGGMTGQSPSASFNFGRAVGAAEYAFKVMGFRVEQVAPQTWKKFMRLKGGKDESRAMAMRLWPHKAGEFKRVKDNDRAEAALIAQYGYRQEKGNVFE